MINFGKSKIPCNSFNSFGVLDFGPKNYSISDHENNNHERMEAEDYIKHRMGTLNPWTVSQRMFIKPFRAKSLRKFWWYWNPGYGYFLLYYCYRPMRKFMPAPVALTATFLLCGFLHDILYLVPMAIMNGGNIPLPFVTTWFLLISTGIIISEQAQVNFAEIRPAFRPALHLGFLVVTFAATVFLSLHL